MAIALVARLLAASDLGPASIEAAWSWNRTDRTKPPTHPAKELRSIKGILASAQFNPRSYANRLRPRLAELASYTVSQKWNFDPVTEKERARELLSDVAWLIDPDIVDRTPTIDDLNRFLDIILAEGEDPSITTGLGRVS